MITTPDGNVGAYGGTGSGARVFVYNPCCNAWGQAAQSMPLFLTEHQVQISNNGAEVFIIGGLEPTYGSVQNVYRQVLRDVPAWTPMVATGGSVDEYTTPDGVTYRTHTFTNTGNSIFSVQSLGSSDGKIDYLLVGGGGGGGSRGGGGGGGGGVTTGLAYVTVQNYTVTVGAGGTGGQGPGAQGAKGGNTTFNGVSAIGGGGGGSYLSRGNNGVAGGSGGSGGGGGGGDSGDNGNDPGRFSFAGAGGARTINQGNVGGGSTYKTDSGGGGGGAAGPGTNPNAYNVNPGNRPGNGGPGRSVQLKTLAAIAYGGGGAATGLIGDGVGTPGTGGGGAAYSNGVDGLGGGGGGGYYASASGYGQGGRGGHGTVIIRYQITP